MELGLPGSAKSAFTCWAMSRALHFNSKLLFTFSPTLAQKKPKCIIFDLKFALERKEMEKQKAEERLSLFSILLRQDRNSPFQVTTLHWKQKNVQTRFIHSV